MNVLDINLKLHIKVFKYVIILSLITISYNVPWRQSNSLPLNNAIVF